MSQYLPNDDVEPTEAEAGEYTEAPAELRSDEDEDADDLGRVRRRATGEVPNGSAAPGDDT
jgi:hypothetical protein